MIHRLQQAAFLLALTAAMAAISWAHEGHSPYAAPGESWQLIELDGKPVAAVMTLEFPEIGSFRGTAPCNRFFGEIWSAYPWFRIDRIATTRRACPELDRETAFLSALQAMSLAEVDGDFLILTGEPRRTMVFRRRAADG